MALDEENVRRFHQEARAAAKLDHENIARVFFCGEDQRLHFIAFEFVEGANLRTVLEQRGRLQVGEAVHYMLQVAAGLAHAAARGVVHRDIKPSNIIVTPNGRAKLVDMGLARSKEPHAEEGLTQSGVTLGTFDYISPEQALEPRDADVRSDIYSLGCTFYHVLTGRPPVPEGTAAKKLHHHQHVRPPDPRQLVPDLPDEVAVILDRMMAKQPRDRYQSPEQLVHHLLLAARKLGSSPEVPEGVISVEATLPSRPAGRPLLLVTLACAAVVGLIIFIDQSTPPAAPTPEQTAVVVNPDAKDKPATQAVQDTSQRQDPPSPSNPGPPTAPPKPPLYKEDKPTAATLSRFLAANQDAKELVIELGGDVELSRDDGETDFLIRNKVVTIRARPGSRPTIRYAYKGQPSSENTQAALAIAAQSSVIEGIRFVIDARGATTPVAAVAYRGGSEHKLKGCEFLTAGAPADYSNRLASVVVEASEAAAPHLACTQCVFLGAGSLERQTSPSINDWIPSPNTLGGQNAVARRGRASLEFVDCAFGPHDATFRLEGAGREYEVMVALRHCSVQASAQSAVFDLADGASANISLIGSLFSHPGDGIMGENRGALMVRQTAKPGDLTCRGQNNRYHNLDGYWYTPDAGAEPTWEEWRKIARDTDSRELRVSPWLSPEPLRRLEKLEFEDAFRVDTRQTDLRFSGFNGNLELVGVEKLTTISYLKDIPKPGTGAPAKAPARLVLDPDPKKADLAAGVYTTLDQVIAVLRPGDAVLIRHNGELKLDPVSLSKKELGDVTLKPHPGYHPVLMLNDKAAGEADTALFRVYDGVLRLEGLEFRLRPGRNEVDAEALVTLAGDGQCVFRGCVVTLDRAGGKASLSVATLPERRNVMPSMEMNPARPRDRGPFLTLENCFVRGEGDLLWARASRPSELEVKNTVVALSGSLLKVEAAREAVTVGGVMVARLTHLTTYLQGPLLHVRAGKDLNGVTAIQCKPDGCLFLPAPPINDRVLVHLEGPEGEETALRSKLTWGEEGGSNAYGGFGCLLDYQGPEEGMKPPPFSMDQWKNFSGEGSIKHIARLAAPPAGDISFTQLLPTHFRPDDLPERFGALVTTLPLPRGSSVPFRSAFPGD
jgi:serine/threonine protein kinase